MRKKNILSYLLLPLSWIYGFVVFMRNLSFDLSLIKQEKFTIPIISVGNITVGGTGKTPHIEYLIRLLRPKYSIAVLSRGYKRKTTGFVLSDRNSDADTIGDEPFQIKSKFPEVIVAVDADRRNGVRKLLEMDKCPDVILLDDAFQHRYIKPGLSLLLIDYNRPIKKDFLLPSGQLREPAASKKRADIIIISKSPENLSSEQIKTLTHDLNPATTQSLYLTTVIPDKLCPVYKNKGATESVSLPTSESSLLLVSGIANPAGLRQYASKISQKITELHFPDHHAFSERDITEILAIFENMAAEEKYIITTEKDAARFQKYSDLPEKYLNRMFYLPISIDFLNGEAENFEKKILGYVEKNKRNGFLHSGKNEISA